MTDFAALIAAGPLLITGMAAAAMLIVYRALSRVAHAVIWSAAFASFALQWVLLLSSGDWTGRTMLLGWPIRAVGLVGLLLYVEGFRVRATGRRSGPVRIVADVALVAAVAWPVPPAWAIVHDAVGPLVTGALFVEAMRLAPREGRRPSATEFAMLAMLAVQALIKFAQGAAMIATLRGVAGGAPLAQAIGQATWLPSGAALGLFSMLLIASDLSVELGRVVDIDPLTGILNRAGFEAAARRAIGRARPPGRPVSLAIADVDRFKAINDRHGHAVGDAALACVATHLADGMSGNDLIGRIGGEEFALLLWGEDGSRAYERLERTRDGLAAACMRSNPDVVVTVSLGVAEHAGGEGLDDVLGRADRALYRSKNQGRDRTTLADSAAIG